MVRFNSFPQRGAIHLVYSHPRLTKSRLFKALEIQVSPKNSILYRILKSVPILFLKQAIKFTLDTPKNHTDYIGLVKNGKPIFFEMDKKSNPIQVWRSMGEGKWEREEFEGFPIIEAYSLEEVKLKSGLLTQVLQRHWEEINNDPRHIHGDFTHFNVLVNPKGGYKFIDQKGKSHSKIFDLFYFHAYLCQNIKRSLSAGSKEKTQALAIINTILKQTVQYSTPESLDSDLRNINLPKTHGLFNPAKSIEEFKAALVNQ